MWAQARGEVKTDIAESAFTSKREAQSREKWKLSACHEGDLWDQGGSARDNGIQYQNVRFCEQEINLTKILEISLRGC